MPEGKEAVPRGSGGHRRLKEEAAVGLGDESREERRRGRMDKRRGGKNRKRKGEGKRKRKKKEKKRKRAI